MSFSKVSAKFFLGLASLSLISMAASAATVQPRIIGGSNASETYPWMVSISNNNDLMNPDCGGTLIDANTVLTAAHCVVDEDNKPLAPERFTINIGEYDTETASPTQEMRQITEVRVHESYEPPKDNTLPVNDIALLRFDESSSHSHIRLADSRTPSIKIGSAMLTMGWGATNGDLNDQENLNFPNILQQVQVPLVNQMNCIAAYESFGTLDPNNMCAGSETGGRDSCIGDSGGPLLYQEGETWYQVGLVSFGPNDSCAAAGTFGAYLRVAPYREWVDCALSSECGVSNGEANTPPFINRVINSIFGPIINPIVSTVENTIASLTPRRIFDFIIGLIFPSGDDEAAA